MKRRVSGGEVDEKEMWGAAKNRTGVMSGKL